MRKTLLSFISAWAFVALLFISTQSFAQVASARWPLTANGNATNVGSITSAAALGGGLALTTYTTATGVATSGWSNDAGSAVADEYYQFAVTANAGTRLNVSSIDYEVSRSQGNWITAVFYSLNNFATAGTQLGSNGVSNSGTPVENTNEANIDVAAGATLTFRIYGWESDGSNRVLRLRNVSISGTSCVLPTVSVTPATATICSNTIQALAATTANVAVAAKIGAGTDINAPGSQTNGSDATGFPTPYGANYENSRQQYLIRASELTAAGLTAGNISSIAFDVLGVGISGVHNGYTISIGNTTQTSIATWETGLTTVFGPSAYQPVLGMNVHTFSTPFNWNGTSNIVVQICHTNDATGSAGNVYTVNCEVRYTTTTGFNSSLTNRADNATVCGLGTILYTENQRPNMILSGVAAPSVVWTPITALYTNAGATTAYTTNTNLATVYARPTANTIYTATASVVGGCSNTATSNLTVTPSPVAGTVSANQTICTGTQPANITIGTSTGSIQWQSSTDNITFNNIGGQTTNTLAGATIGNLTATRYYRAVLSSTGCTAVNSAVVTVTVTAASVAGSVSSNQTICSGTQPASITIGTSTGTIQWQSSTDNVTFNNIGGQTTNTLAGATIGNLTATHYYRAVVTNGVCASAISAVVTVTVDAVSVGGTIAGSTTVCANANSGTLTLSAYTGNVIKWQSSDFADFSAAVLDIPNTTSGLSYLNLSSTTYFRAVVANGVCASANSAVAAITVDQAAVGGTVNGSTSVCYGNNSGSLTLSGNSGAVTGWESSLDNFATAGTPIANTTTTLNYSNLTAATSYRAIVSGGTCSSAVSSSATVTVNNSTNWLGTQSTSWDDPANWSCGVVPTTDIDVTITAVTNQPIVSADAFAKTLTLQTGTTLAVQSNAALTVVGVIDGQGTSVLTVENDAHVIQVNDVDNTGNAVVKRDSNPLKRLDYILWSTPVTGAQTLLNFSPLTIATRFYVYNPSTNLYNTTPTSGTFAEGKGYLIRMPDNHPTTPTVFNGIFNGTLNNGDVNVTVANNTYNAIGNPYPSAIDADAFITQNNLTEALYFWRKTNNATTTSYATYTLAGGVGTSSNTGGDPMLLVPDGTIQPGQGFIAKSTSTALSFNNGMRTGNNGQFFRSQVERNRIWLNLTNAEGIFSQTMVSYMTGASNELDAAIDGLYFNDSQLALTSIIGSAEYAIQGRALPFSNSDVVPLGMKVIAAGTYTIGLDHVDGLFNDVSQNIFLKDNLLNLTHDLRTGNYTFAAEEGSINNRFELVYEPLLAVNNPTFDANQVIVYKQGNDLIVNSGKVVMDQVKVFDIRGRLLVEKDNVNASETKLNAGTANQVLVVRITSKDNKVVTKKVVN